MQSITWSDDLSVGVYILDADHQFLIRLIRKFNDAIDGKQPRDRIIRTLEEVYEYTDFHFLREEVLMRACGYTDIDAHHAVHVKLRNQMKDYLAKFEADASPELAMELRGFLNDWLTKHIMGQDKKYAPIMAGKDDKIAEAHAYWANHHSETESAESTEVY